MTRLCITRVLEKMNALDRLMEKYDDRSTEYYQKGDLERSIKWDHRVDLIERQIEGIRYTLTTLGLGVWKTRDGQWVIPDDDIKNAI